MGSACELTTEILGGSLWLKSPVHALCTQVEIPPAFLVAVAAMDVLKAAPARGLTAGEIVRASPRPIQPSVLLRVLDALVESEYVQCTEIHDSRLYRYCLEARDQ